jgi:predicted porin
MNKKLMAAAVAGALTLPAGAAMAQTSTVQIYGLFNVEYAPYVKNPDGIIPAPFPGAGTRGSRHTTDELNSGASRIGFRGQEKLGAGLTAWFQCETDLQFLDGGTDSGAEVFDTNSQNDTAWCDRNSALGLRGGWGNFYIGTWDSPAKRVTSATRMLAETGWLGVQRHLMTLGGWGYSHRVTKSINYDSPNFGGFTIAVQTTTTNADRDQFDVGADTEARIWGINGMYSAGPLVVGLAHQRYENNIQFVTPPFPVGGGAVVGGVFVPNGSESPVPGTTDKVWVFGINYTFGNFKVGFVATDLEAERAPAGAENLERRNYNVALEWNLGGPHSVLFGWTHAGATEGTGVGAGSTSSGSANIFQAQYQHRFSKRTMGGIGVITVDNGDGGVHRLQSLGAPAPGERSTAAVLQLQHTF